MTITLGDCVNRVMQHSPENMGTNRRNRTISATNCPDDAIANASEQVNDADAKAKHYEQDNCLRVCSTVAQYFYSITTSSDDPGNPAIEIEVATPLARYHAALIRRRFR